MIHSYIRTFILAAAVATAGVTIGRAAGGGSDPRPIVYRGYLEDAQGPIDGRQVSLVFQLHATAEGVEALWTSGTENVAPTGGHFSVVLGDDSSLAPVWDNMPASGRLFLSMSVDGQALLGRQEIFPTAFAVSGVPQAVFRAQDAHVAGTLTAAVASLGQATVTASANVEGDLRLGGDLQTRDLRVSGDISADSNVVGACDWSGFVDSAEFGGESPSFQCESGRFVAGIQIRNSPADNMAIDMVRVLCCEL